jgi:cell division protein FtsB
MAYKRAQKIGLGTALFFALFLALSSYFSFAAIQGDYGHIKRIQIESEERRLTLRLDSLKLEREQLKNKTYRLSDGYLDLDLLDERVRKVLGMARVNDVIIR